MGHRLPRPVAPLPEAYQTDQQLRLAPRLNPPARTDHRDRRRVWQALSPELVHQMGRLVPAPFVAR